MLYFSIKLKEVEMKKIRTGHIIKENGFWVVYYRVNGIKAYRKEFIKKSEAVKFLWQDKVIETNLFL
jgi:hypothetical protein